jgi:hypothetical protein
MLVQKFAASASGRWGNGKYQTKPKRIRDDNDFRVLLGGIRDAAMST